MPKMVIFKLIKATDAVTFAQNFENDVNQPNLEKNPVSLQKLYHTNSRENHKELFANVEQHRLNTARGLELVFDS